ncbi:hypothetical protein AB3M95_14700 [Metabacillus niabensis]
MLKQHGSLEESKWLQEEINNGFYGLSNKTILHFLIKTWKIEVICT